MSKKEPKNYNEIEAKDNMKIENPKEDIIEEKEQFKKVISSEPVKVKRNLFSRLVQGVVGPDGLPGIGAYVNEEIVKPAIKNIIVDAITSGVNLIMYGDKGDGRHRGGYSNYRGPSYSNYRPTTNYQSQSSYSRPGGDGYQQSQVRVARGGVKEYIIPDRYDAAHVLTTLTENADRYGSVSVADYYDLIGVESVFTDNQHGWTFESISRATIIPTRGGFVIKFPPVEVI